MNTTTDGTSFSPPEQIEALEQSWRLTQQAMRFFFKAARVGLTVDRSELSPSELAQHDAQLAYFARVLDGVKAFQASLDIPEAHRPGRRPLARQRACRREPPPSIDATPACLTGVAWLCA